MVDSFVFLLNLWTSSSIDLVLVLVLVVPSLALKMIASDD